MSIFRNYSLLRTPNLGLITYVGSASNPADNGLTNTSPVAVTPPSMKAGDLVYLMAQNREIQANITSIAMSQLGGQTWTEVMTFGGTGVDPPTMKLFTCRFNGTWSANPSVAFVTTTPVNSAVMHVFRPANPAYNWRVDGSTIGSWSDAVPPFQGLITGVTPTKNVNVTIASWHAGSAVTFTNLVGSGWTTLGANQYRNLAGSDQSMSFAYKIQNSATATGDVQKDVSAGGGGVTSIITFYQNKFL
jgi:hypothetical protein